MPIIKATAADAAQALKDIDWAKLDAMTDEDIARQIADNPDAAPDMTERLLRRHSVDIAALRKRLDMTQAEFARAYRFSLGAVRSLEQGIRSASGPVAAYLQVIEANPDVVRTALGVSFKKSDTGTKNG